MALVDLHSHSLYSEHPSDWFLQRLGARESYTDPEEIYLQAKKNGMSYVTLTDHNSIMGALILKSKYPQDTFIGVETTTYFPEDGCKIHILIFDIDEEEFKKIQRLRENIYKLRNFLKENDIAYSVAHATYSINQKLTINHLEKLILLFDVFEGINGGRNQTHNSMWCSVLRNLTPQIISDLQKKHNIEPISSDPWIKGFTGGSDDHAGIFVGKTYTYAETDSIESFIELLKKKKTLPSGRHNDYQSLAFSIYKIAYDFSKHQKRGASNSFFNQLSEMLFTNQSLTIFDNFNIKRMRKKSMSEGEKAKHLLYDLVYNLKTEKKKSIEDKLGFIFDRIEIISDEFFLKMFELFEQNLKSGDLFNFFKIITSSLPGIFLSLPFFTTIKHMAQGKELLDELNARFVKSSRTGKKVLWFTDTINDLNGVSETLKHLGWFSFDNKHNIYLVTCLPDSELNEKLPPNIINLKYLYEFQIPIYKSYKLRVPSVLNSLSKISRFCPDEIYISTPGPVGLLGLLASYLLSIKSTGIYHTDFTLQCDKIEQNESLINLTESYTRWFYSAMSNIKVPTKEYISILVERGFNKAKMTVFNRGIDIRLFAPIERNSDILKTKYGIEGGVNLLFTGRVSKDKNIDFLIEVYKKLAQSVDHVNLVITGDGPYLRELKKKYSSERKIIFTGSIVRDQLPEIYSLADIFLFPSNTDTFGMSVLEAQACGIPVIVSDKGGPQEIVIKGKSGFIMPSDNLDEWVGKILEIIKLRQNEPMQYNSYKIASRANVFQNYCWEKFLDDLYNDGDDELRKSSQEKIDIKAVPHW